MRNIILHLLQWRLTDITERLEEISKQGFNMIQVSPIQPHKPGGEWWKLYQPLSFTVGNDIGTKEDLIALCREAKKYNIKIIVDIVLRHLAGTDDGKLVPHQDSDKAIMNNPDFWTNAENATNWGSREQTIYRAAGMPMLDYNNAELQDIYARFIDEILSCGAYGIRIDMGKHFALPDEGSLFWTRVIDGRGQYNYAECLDCDKRYLDKYAEYVDILTNSEMSDDSKKISFMESHDTFLTFKSTCWLKDNDIINQWGGLLGRTKGAVLFYARPWSNLWADQRIKEINLRNR